MPSSLLLGRRDSSSLRNAVSWELSRRECPQDRCLHGTAVLPAQADAG